MVMTWLTGRPVPSRVGRTCRTWRASSGAYGSPLGKMRLVGGVWRATAGTFWALLLGASQVRGRLRATPHAVVIVDEPSPVTRSELGRLTAIFGAMVLAVVAFQATAIALLIALGAGSRWVRWGPLGMLLIMMVMLIVEVTPVCRRATQTWGRTARVGRELRAAGGSVMNHVTGLARSGPKAYPTLA